MEQQSSKFDMVFNFREVEVGLELELEYNTDIYSERTASQLCRHLEQLLGVMVQNADSSINHLSYLNATEERQLLEEFNNTSVAYPQDETIVSLFEEQVRRTPGSIAVVYEDRELSYGQLNEWSNALGDYLVQRYGIRADDLIGISLVRSEWMVISILGILKSGGAYVPIDPEYPQERIDYMIKDSGCRVVIDEAELEVFRSEHQRYSKDNLNQRAQPQHLAYVIYTSGSTGNPKGVMIEHRNIYSRIKYFQDMYDLGTRDRALFYTSHSFDASIEEYLLPVMTGGKCFIAPMTFKQDILNNMFRFIEDKKITKVNMPPVLLGEFVQSVEDGDLHKLNSLKHVVSGGDRLTLKIVKAVSYTHLRAHETG